MNLADAPEQFVNAGRSKSQQRRNSGKLSENKADSTAVSQFTHTTNTAAASTTHIDTPNQQTHVPSGPGTNAKPPTKGVTLGSICLGLAHVLLMVLAPIALFTLFATLYAAIRQEKTVRSRPAVVDVRGKVLFVDDKPFIIRGVNFSPVWASKDARTEYPFGDYMGDGDFTGYCDSHLAKIAQAGFNTIRIYSWILSRDHTAFLDIAHKHGLKVIVTFWMDSGLYPDLAKNPELALTNFRHMVRSYKRHPAVLLWAIGNEPNLPSNPLSFATQLRAFFFFIRNLREVRDQEELGQMLHPHPMMVPLADFNVVDIIAENDPAVVEIWGIQLYRSVQDLDSILTSIQTDKPILVSEFGMDSYIDMKQTRLVSAFLPRSETERIIAERNQAVYLRDMVRVFNKYLAVKTPNSTDVETLPHNLPALIPTSPSSRCAPSVSTGTLEQRWLTEFNCPQFNKVIGTVVFEWMDEWWKAPPDDLWHPDCTTDDASKQSACGIWQKDFGDDERLNEEYFGLVRQPFLDPGTCRLVPKPAYCAFAKWYRGPASGSNDCLGLEVTATSSSFWTFKIPVPWTSHYTVEIHLGTVGGLAGAFVVVWLAGGTSLWKWLTMRWKKWRRTRSASVVPIAGQANTMEATTTQTNPVRRPVPTSPPATANADQREGDTADDEDETPPLAILFGPNPRFAIEEVSVDQSRTAASSMDCAFNNLHLQVARELQKISLWLGGVSTPSEKDRGGPFGLVRRTYMSFVASALYRVKFFLQNTSASSPLLFQATDFTVDRAQFAQTEIVQAVRLVYADLIAPPPDDNEAAMASVVPKTDFDFVFNVLLFLVIQQRLENLRQAKWMKWKLWRWCSQRLFQTFD